MGRSKARRGSHKQCRNKRSFSRRAAYLVAEKTGHRPYHCRQCNRWHLTKNPI